MFKIVSFFNVVPRSLANAEPHRVIWEPVSWLAAIKVGVLNVQSKSFSPQKEAGSWGMPPNYKALRVCGGGLRYGTGMYQLFLLASMWAFSQTSTV